MSVKEKMGQISAYYKSAKESNLYHLSGAVPFKQRYIFGLETVLVMVLCNVTPILAVFPYFGSDAATISAVQGAFIWSGISTLIGLYVLFVFGSGLPVVAGISFTFMGSLALVASQFDLGTLIGSLFVGGFVLILISLTAKYINKIIKPIVKSIVLISVGFSLIEESVINIMAIEQSQNASGASAFYDFSLAWPYLIPAFTALFVSFILYFNLHGYHRYFSVAAGLLSGYIASWIVQAATGKVLIDYSGFSFSSFTDIFSVPHLVDFSIIRFSPGPIIFVSFIFLICATEDLVNYSELSLFGLNREATAREIRGGLLLSGVMSLLSACFGSMPITVSSQNAGFTIQTGVKNRSAYVTSAVFLIILGLFPPVSIFLCTMPYGVLAGALLPIYLAIIIVGMQMFFKAGLTVKNGAIFSLSLGLGYGLTLLDETFFNQSTFGGGEFSKFCLMFFSSPEAMMFTIAFALSFLIPDRFGNAEMGQRDKKTEMKIEKAEEEEKGASFDTDKPIH